MKRTKANDNEDRMGINRIRIKAKPTLLAAAALLFAALALLSLMDRPSDEGGTGASATALQQREKVNTDTSIDAIKSSGIPAVKMDPQTDTEFIKPPLEQPTKPPASESFINNEDTLIVRYLDVGQGDSALISCAGRNLLIDGGTAGASSKLYSILERLGIDRLDYVIASHPDADHCGGISGALTYAECGMCFSPTAASDTDAFAKLVRTLDKQGAPITVPSRGDSFELGQAKVTFIGPTQTFTNDNNSSLVVRIDHGSTSFLFTGDAESESEYSLVANQAPLHADVLKVGHHGSSTSTKPRFLSAVDPIYAIISVGSNSYGHPSSTVLDELTNRDIKIMRTDTDGTIIAKSDGSTLILDSVKGIINE